MTSGSCWAKKSTGTKMSWVQYWLTINRGSSLTIWGKTSTSNFLCSDSHVGWAFYPNTCLPISIIFERSFLSYKPIHACLPLPIASESIRALAMRLSTYQTEEFSSVRQAGCLQPIGNEVCRGVPTTLGVKNDQQKIVSVLRDFGD